MNPADEIVAIVDDQNLSLDPRPAATCARTASRPAAPTFWSSTPAATCACRNAPPRRRFPPATTTSPPGASFWPARPTRRAPGANSPRRSAFTACPSPTSSSSTTRTTTPRCGQRVLVRVRRGIGLAGGGSGKRRLHARGGRAVARRACALHAGRPVRAAALFGFNA